MIAHVIADEKISQIDNFQNGSSPLWAYGSRSIVRHEDCVYAVVPEIGKDVQPLCNTRWTLWRRPDAGSWERMYAAPVFNEREPCLLIRLPDGQLLISTNPAQSMLCEMSEYANRWICQPQLVRVFPENPERKLQTITPHWKRPYLFSEHSYRAFAADAQSGHVFLAHQIETAPHDIAWMLLDKDGNLLCQEELRFPMRGCYLQVAISGTAVSIMALSDEIEPNPEWRGFKQELTGQGWDFDFRQIYFISTPDVLTEKFSNVSTVANCDSTAGRITNLDLWIDADGDAHILLLERNVWVYAMRDRFFPGLPINVSLQYLRVRKGCVISRRTLAEVTEDMGMPRPAIPPPGSNWWEYYEIDPAWQGAGPKPVYATFHTAADQSLHVLYTLKSGDKEQLWIRQVYPVDNTPQRIELQHPLGAFNAASPRNGCIPGNIIDVYGYTDRPTETNDIRYVSICLE